MGSAQAVQGSLIALSAFHNNLHQSFPVSFIEPEGLERGQCVMHLGEKVSDSNGWKWCA